jgi:hypothetical protein
VFHHNYQRRIMSSSTSNASLWIRTILMPASQAVAWHMILRQRPLLAQVWKISLFYCLWALWNRYGTGAQELGHFSMGLLTLAAYYNHRRAAIAATTLVLLNFLVALGIVVTWTTHDIAAKMKKRDDGLAMTWAHMFQLYVLSNLALWTMVLVELVQQTPAADSYSAVLSS